MSLINRVRLRDPDFTVGPSETPYLLRWYLTPWSRYDRVNPPWWAQITKRLLPNVYVHCFKRSDEARALHDHPWLFNISFLLRGVYIEETIAYGGIKHRTMMKAGDWKVRGPWATHRVELLKACDALTQGDKVVKFTTVEMPCWTLFITGPVVREWGFHCLEAGWVHWKKFVSIVPGGNSFGKGCDQ